MSIGLIKERKMAQKKESIEVHCAGCKTGFRLWIPAEAVPEWEKGVRINCIKCGAPHFVERGKAGFDVSLIEIEPAVRRALAEAPSVRLSTALKKEAHAARRKTAVVEEAVPEIEEEIPALEDEQTVDNILHIEDDKLSQKMVENVLKGIDVKLLAVKNAAEALKALKKEKINLIITDLYLKNPNDPESLMDGEELLKSVVDMGLNIPSIITTGKAIIDDLELEPKWFDLHVKGFIQKGNPFWADELKLKIKETLCKD